MTLRLNELAPAEGAKRENRRLGPHRSRIATTIHARKGCFYAHRTARSRR